MYATNSRTDDPLAPRRITSMFSQCSAGLREPDPLSSDTSVSSHLSAGILLGVSRDIGIKKHWNSRPFIVDLAKTLRHSGLPAGRPLTPTSLRARSQPTPSYSSRRTVYLVLSTRNLLLSEAPDEPPSACPSLSRTGPCVVGSRRFQECSPRSFKRGCIPNRESGDSGRLVAPSPY